MPKAWVMLQASQAWANTLQMQPEHHSKKHSPIDTNRATKYQQKHTGDSVACGCAGAGPAAGDVGAGGAHQGLGGARSLLHHPRACLTCMCFKCVRVCVCDAVIPACRASWSCPVALCTVQPRPITHVPIHLVCANQVLTPMCHSHPCI